MSTSSPPPGGLVCNTSINGKQYYTSVLADVGKVLAAQLSMVFNLYAGISACCCFILFLILALTLNGPTNIGTILVYLCLLCQGFAIAYNAYRYFRNKRQINKVAAESKPCINNPELDKKK